MFSVKLLRSTARALPRFRIISRRFPIVGSASQFRSLQTQDASRPSPFNRPRTRLQKVASVDLSKPQWAESEEAGRVLKIHFTGKDKRDIVATGQFNSKTFPAMFLRDACTCHSCVDPNSTQKNFSTTDIPLDIKIKSVECTETGLEIAWENDISGFGDDHISVISPLLLETYLSETSLRSSMHNDTNLRAWTRIRAQELMHFEHAKYMNDDELLFKALRQLDRYGFIILNGVPEDEKSVEHIAERIGTLRDTFYGRTWNVKSVPQAKNVAYTQQYLGLHMDLLYMHNPPGLQFLHCLKNTCEGGASLLSDSFNAALKLRGTDFEESLGKLDVAYHYKNDGQYYYNEHKLIEKRVPQKPISLRNIKYVNFSPPFQAPFPSRQHPHILASVGALKAFTDVVEAEENLFEYRLKEGECVIFNNRRVLHGRREFDSTSGERWLKGCYVDTDVFESRLRVMRETIPEVSKAEMETQPVISVAE